MPCLLSFTMQSGAVDFMAFAALGLLSVSVFLSMWLAARSRYLVESRRLLQLVLDNVAEGVAVLDANQKVILHNTSAVRIIGAGETQPAYILAQEHFEAFSFDGDPLPPDRWPVPSALRGEFMQNRPLFFRNTSTGTMELREITTAPVPGRQGNRRQIMVRYHDTTDRYHLDQAHALCAAIVDSSDDAIVGKDTNSIVTSWNKGAEYIFGYAASEMIGQSIRRLLPTNRLAEEDDIMRRVLNDEHVVHFETTRITKDLRIIEISLTVSPIKDKTGRIIGASKIAREITQTRSLERQLRQSQKMEAIGQLTGGIAHDFNNLLGIILGNLEMLQEEIQTPVANAEGGHRKIAATSKRNQTAQQAAQRAADLTRRLLAFSSHEQLNPAAVRLSDVIRNTLGLAVRALGPQVEVVVNLDESLPAILVDRSGLENALLNLAVNSRDAMPNGGTLRVTTELAYLDSTDPSFPPLTVNPGPYARITLSDNGEGMSQQTLDRAFEPFFTTKERGHGTGLGLAMVYGFLKQSNGTARIYSEPGYGTTVSLYLPFASTDCPVAEPQPQVAERAGDGIVVLLVDDETALLEVANAYLSRLGYTTLTAIDGNSALSLVSTHPHIDVMITDIVMPGGMNGAELVHRVREIAPATHCIYTSGFPADALAQKGFNITKCEMLRKPYRLAELASAVQKALNKSSSTPKISS